MSHRVGDPTTIKIRRDTWDELDRRKRPGDSHDDVINRLLDAAGDDVPRVQWGSGTTTPDNQS